jgi:hypothetical protein
VRSHPSLLVALSTTAALAACGSSASSTAPSTKTALAHSELVSRADAICKRANDRIAAAKKVSAGHGLPYASIVALVNDELPILTAEVNGLQSLAPSGGDQEAFEEYLRAARGELVSVRSVRDASTRREASGYRSATLELLTQSTRAVQAAGHLGLVECAKRPEPQG